MSSAGSDRAGTHLENEFFGGAGELQAGFQDHAVGALTQFAAACGFGSDLLGQRLVGGQLHVREMPGLGQKVDRAMHRAAVMHRQQLRVAGATGVVAGVSNQSAPMEDTGVEITPIAPAGVAKPVDA